MTNPTNTFLHTLADIAQHNDHRYGVVFDGDFNWQNMAISAFLENAKSQTTFQLGGVPLNDVTHAPVKKVRSYLVANAKFLFVILENSLTRMVSVLHWGR